MTPRQLHAWSLLAERRAGWARKRAQPMVALGLALVAWVWWRTHDGGIEAGQRAWFAMALVVSAVTFLRVPFALYWRADAPLLAQLPIEGKALLDVALARCLRGGIGLAVLLVVAMAPFVSHALGAGAPDSLPLAARYGALGLGLGAAAAGFVPAVSFGAAVLVVRGGGGHAVRVATAVAMGSPRRVAQATAEAITAKVAPTANATTQPNSSAILGALPGVASTVVVVAVIAAWTSLESHAPYAVGAGLVVASAIGVALARRGGDWMAQVLRDVSALDRQRLATLDIRPPTALERLFGAAAGAGRLVYGKDARLVRRRYPLAFALGFVGFVWLFVVGCARPADPAWLAIPLAGGVVYGLVLSARLRVPPIELPRLARALPLPRAAFAAARIAWLAGWWLVFFAAPGLFAALRADPALGLALVGGGTLVVLGSGAK
ncbi:MAG TPA: hypothetical protein VGM88_24365 [Kofleriaceae bacterium]